MQNDRKSCDFCDNCLNFVRQPAVCRFIELHATKHFFCLQRAMECWHQNDSRTWSKACGKLCIDNEFGVCASLCQNVTVHKVHCAWRWLWKALGVDKHFWEKKKACQIHYSAKNCWPPFLGPTWKHRKASNEPGVQKQGQKQFLRNKEVGTTLCTKPVTPCHVASSKFWACSIEASRRWSKLCTWCIYKRL